MSASLGGRIDRSGKRRPALRSIIAGCRDGRPIASRDCFTLRKLARRIYTPPRIGYIESSREAPMNELIAIIEDEPDLASLTSQHLRKEGFRAETFSDAERFFRSLARRRPDLIILDLMLPDMNGLDVCRALKKNEDWRSIPVIMATARAEETDKVLGLELGADDYVTKPFSFRELAARIKAVLRRRAPDEGKGPVEVGDLVIDPERYEARLQGRPLDLTSTEFKILRLLASRRGRVLTREQILDELWGRDKIVLDRTIDVHIKNLREKMGSSAGLIKNIRGVGYKVEE